MSKIESLPQIVNVGVENMPYYVPKQPVKAGTAVDPQPDGKEIPPLFKPLKIRGLNIQNRIGVSPMCMYSCRNGLVTPWHLQHYASWAVRGPGVIIGEASAVAEEGRISPECAGLWSDEHAKAWAPILELIHSQDQLMGVQLAHAGRKSSTIAWFWDLGRSAREDENGWPDKVVAPSPVSINPDLLYTPKELTVDQIHTLVKQFGAAAKRAVEIAKFDFLEIHAAHGYLICEFLSESSNKRTDEYGGSFENRIRFLTEIIKEVRANISKDVPLFIRLSASENIPDDPEAWTIEDTKNLADVIIPLGIDLIDVSSGGNNRKQERRGHQEGFHVNLTEALKEHVGDRCLVSTVGGLRHAEFANNLLKEGKTDFVFVGRRFLKKPGLVWEWADDLGVKLHHTQELKRADLPFPSKSVFS